MNQDLTRNALIGSAIGDALGVPVEFLSREEVRAIGLKDMIGCYDALPFTSWWSYRIPAGAWSDDTSMLIAGMDAIITENGNLNYETIMENFLSWWADGKYTSLDAAFGLGYTVSQAMQRYRAGRPALECGGTDLHDNGNGALMRILPFSLYAIKKQMSEAETVDLIGKASSLTHAHEISKMSCFLYTEFLRNLSITADPHQAFDHILQINYNAYFSPETIKAHEKILNPDFLYIQDSEISEKNGYVVPTLESALYSLLTTESFEDAVLKSINMGYDTDTVGCVTGGLAGAVYGYDQIPKRWLCKLIKRDMLEKMADDFDQLFDV